MLLLAGACVSNGGFILPPREGPVGKRHRPSVVAVAAQTEIGIGYLWKIYLRAADPDDDLDKIYIVFAQLGHGGYPPEPVLLRGPVREINGAILTWTVLSGSGNQSGPLYGSAEIWVEDRAGNTSEPKVFQFTLDTFGSRDEYIPPPSFNADIVYGQVTFPIQSDDDLVGDDGNDADVGRGR